MCSSGKLRIGTNKQMNRVLSIKIMLYVVSFCYLGALSSYLLLRLAFGDGFWWLSLFNTFAPLLFAPLSVLLVAALLKRKRVLILWSVFLSVIALGWFGPYFLPKRTSPASQQAIMVATYNMHDTSEGLSSWLLATQPDLVFLQEVPQSGNGSMQTAKLRDGHRENQVLSLRQREA